MDKLEEHGVDGGGSAAKPFNAPTSLPGYRGEVGQKNARLFPLGYFRRGQKGRGGYKAPLSRTYHYDDTCTVDMSNTGNYACWAPFIPLVRTSIIL